MLSGSTHGGAHRLADRYHLDKHASATLLPDTPLPAYHATMQPTERIYLTLGPAPTYSAPRAPVAAVAGDPVYEVPVAASSGHGRPLEPLYAALLSTPSAPSSYEYLDAEITAAVDQPHRASQQHAPAAGANAAPAVPPQHSHRLSVVPDFLPSYHDAENGGLPLDPDVGEMLPDFWEKRVLASGTVYFVDNVKQETYWTLPAQVEPQFGVYIPLPAGWEFRMKPEPHFLNTLTGVVHQRDPRPLPFGWEQLIDHRGFAFFVCHVTHETRWTHPCSFNLADESEPRAPPVVPTLPFGWTVAYTFEGAMFYLDHNTETTHWELPAQ